MSLTLLALDTSTEACSAALLRQGEIISQFVVAERAHTKNILPMIDRILFDADCTLGQIDAIAFTRGPGSFTGVRIGIGIAQGLALGADKPLIPISTLETLAQGAFRVANATHVVVAIDARMNEVYAAQYRYSAEGKWLINGIEQVMSPDKILDIIDHRQNECPYYAGTGFDTYPAMVGNSKPSGVSLPHAEDMIPIAEKLWYRNEVVKVDAVKPIYLRNSLNWKKLSGRS